MNQFHKLFRWAWSALAVFTLAFAMGGCDGKDGATGPAGQTGPAGATGPQGDPGPAATVRPLESCGVCHDSGHFADAANYHALNPIAFGENVSFSIVGADLAVSFSLVVDGAAGLGYDTVERGYQTDGATRTDICNAPSRSAPCDAGSLSVIENGNGNYTLTVIGGATVANDNRYLFRVSDGGERATRVYFFGDYGLAPVATPVVSAQACENCHGPEGIGIHGGYYAMEDGVEPCLVCHGVDTVPTLATVAHEYHSGLLDEITYPTYMNNCSVCHSEPAQLAVVNAMPVVADACFTCHGSTAGIPFPPGSPAATVHANIVDGCDACHAGQIGGIPQTVAQAHNGATTERGGIIWDGVDTAVEEGKKFNWEILGVVDDGTNLAISWQASYNGVGVDPCNATVGAGAPVFFNGNTMRFYRSYAQGDDFIIGMSTNSPGQALSATLTVDNTTCAAGIATTTIPVDAVTADKGRLALGGKPTVFSEANPALTVAARVPTPTYDWLVGDGTAAVARRDIVDTGECLKCHVGSLYQHGGDRVDNVDMCLVCHNAASNEKNVRVSTMGIDPADTYDGRTGQTFELKSMLHRIHSAGLEGQQPVVIYRGRGVYAFGPDRSGLANWPGEGSQVVYGSTIANDGSPGSYTTPHHFHAPTFPRAVNDCAACHKAGSVDFVPDQTEAMASTDDAGGSDDWSNQVDDVLQGAATTACVTCHTSGLAKGHAYQNSWEPQAFPEGRKTIIDAVK